MSLYRRSSIHPSERDQERGFSLLELLVVVAILTIAASAAIPNYLRWNATYRLKQAASELHGSLSLARMVAMNRNATVTMSLGVNTCPPAIQACNQHTAVFDQSMTPLIFPPGVGATITPSGSTVRFSSLGLRTSAAGTATQTIVLRNESGASYVVEIATSGRVRLCPGGPCV